MPISLEKIATNIWIAEGKCVNFYGFAYPTRSVIIRLSSGALWIWSPVELTESLKSEVEKLGNPAFLVSPNNIHHLFLDPWQQAFPAAKLCGPQSTIDKRSDLNFEIVLDSDAPTAWSKDIDQEWFNGSFYMDEFVFFHRQSKTVIMADLSENFSKSFLQKHWSYWQRWIANLWGIVEGRGYAPLEWRLSFLRKKQTQASRDRVLSWDPIIVIMAHGEWQRSEGRAFLEKSFSWM